jgi:hypothetical protein
MLLDAQNWNLSAVASELAVEKNVVISRKLVMETTPTLQRDRRLPRTHTEEIASGAITHGPLENATTHIETPTNMELLQLESLEMATPTSTREDAIADTPRKCEG